MMGGYVDDYRTVQFFLAETGVYEVSADKNNKFFKCTCTGYTARKKCKHIDFVKERTEDNLGVYPTEVSSKATKEEATEAALSNDTFREFLIKYGKVEVV
jgi:hypothetical protein